MTLTVSQSIKLQTLETNPQSDFAVLDPADSDLYSGTGGRYQWLCSAKRNLQSAHVYDAELDEAVRRSHQQGDYDHLG